MTDSRETVSLASLKFSLSKAIVIAKDYELDIR